MNDQDFGADLIAPGRATTRHPRSARIDLVRALFKRRGRRLQLDQIRASEGIVRFAHRSVRSYLSVETAMTLTENRELFALEEQTERRRSLMLLVARRIMLLTKRRLRQRIKFQTVSKSNSERLVPRSGEHN